MIPNASKRSPLARDLTAVLAIKLVLLLILWFVFFRAPPQADNVEVGRAVLGVAESASNTR